MRPIKEVHFNHEGQDYFISLPTASQSTEQSYLNSLLADFGIQPVYHVEEDVKGRYLTILVNKSLRMLEGTPLPDGVELRQGTTEPYLYLAKWMAIIAYDEDWLAVVDGVWKRNR
ncbi:MAG: hypothetical protein MUC59_12390 [Saprospiraceae bacterium]|jgi:hypothetical protein|nr:hypothetical protein [Saprospiraceae bacterium]